VHEIEASLPGVTMCAFTPVVCERQPEGVLAVVSGRVPAGALTAAELGRLQAAAAARRVVLHGKPGGAGDGTVDDAEVDVAQVTGTCAITWRLALHFTQDELGDEEADELARQPQHAVMATGMSAADDSAAAATQDSSFPCSAAAASASPAGPAFSSPGFAFTLTCALDNLVFSAAHAHALCLLAAGRLAAPELAAPPPLPAAVGSASAGSSAAAPGNATPAEKGQPEWAAEVAVAEAWFASSEPPAHFDAGMRAVQAFVTLHAGSAPEGSVSAAASAGASEAALGRRVAFITSGATTV